MGPLPCAKVIQLPGSSFEFYIEDESSKKITMDLLLGRRVNFREVVDMYYLAGKSVMIAIK